MLEWALAHADAKAPRRGEPIPAPFALDARRRADGAARGRRVADPHRSDVRSAGPHVPLRSGDGVDEDDRPRHRADDARRRSTSVLLTHDHHADNLDDAGRALLPHAGVVVTTARGAGRLRREVGTACAGSTRGRRTAPRAGRPTDDRGDRDAVPPRSAAQPTARRRRRSGFSLAWDGQRHGDAVDLGRHRPLRRRAPGRVRAST